MIRKGGQTRHRIQPLLLMLALLATSLGTTACQSPVVVNIPDGAFRQCLQQYLTQPDQPITDAQLAKIHGNKYGYLDCEDARIVSIEGAQYLTNRNLTHLTLDGNQISDLAPLTGLTNLTYLGVDRNQINDLSPLAGLTNLHGLSIGNNQITDLGPVAGLTTLTGLIVEHNQISDLSPLTGLTNLIYLDGQYNQISDLSPLAGLTNLTALSLSNNRISDIRPLANTPAILSNTPDSSGYGSFFYGFDQTVTLPPVSVGTIPPPIISTAPEPAIVTVTTGPAVVNPDGSITLTAPGQVKLTWSVSPGVQTNAFDGTATLTVT